MINQKSKIKNQKVNSKIKARVGHFGNESALREEGR